MRTIKLAIFNEDYWSKGLVYSQNILPLIILSKTTGCNVEVISFTSFFVFLRNRNTINDFKDEMKEQGIKVKNYYTLYYPTRFLISRWFMIPFLLLNTFIYIWYLRITDMRKNVVYNLRSYQIAKCFHSFYGNYDRLIFDTRTDYIEECINSGYFKKNGLSERLWKRYEKEMLSDFNKTLFISETFKNNVLKRHNLIDNKKYLLLYNTIDYSRFNVKRNKHNDTVFLYTGSLGQWNRLETYLDFFAHYHELNNNSRLIICTSTSAKRVNPILSLPCYNSIKRKISVYYNIPTKKLPFYYAQCDFGLQLMQKKDSRVGVKVVEYIAAGIVPIVHVNVQGATEVLKKYHLGIIIDDFDTPLSIYNKLLYAPHLDKNSQMYKSFKRLTDLNSINNLLKQLYLN